MNQCAKLMKNRHIGNKMGVSVGIRALVLWSTLVSYSRIISILPMSRLAEIRSGMRDERSTWHVTG